MEKTVDHCNIFVDELGCKLVLVIHCKHGEKKESEREKEKQKEKETEIKEEMETERDKKGKERKASKEIRNDAEVEHTSCFVADKMGISGV